MKGDDMSNEVIERLEEKIDTQTEMITQLRIEVGILKKSMNGGVGNSRECIQHRTDIQALKGQLRLYAGAIVVIVAIMNLIGPVLMRHLFP